MNERRLAMLVAEVSLAEDRSLAAELQTVPGASVRGMASAASAGNLAEALSLAGFERELADLGAAWPRAVRIASTYLDRLPSVDRLYLPLFQTAAYFFLITLLQGVILFILKSKLFGVMHKIAQDLGAAGPYRWAAALAFFVIGVLLLTGFAILGATGWSRLPGWGRHLARARDASLIAALVQARAPSDVVSGWVRKTRTLQELGEDARSEDLLSIAADSGVSAERAMTRFVTSVRIVGYGLLTLLALGVTLDVYLFIASLARTR